MKTPPNNLQEVLQNMLTETQASGIKYEKLFKEFSDLAHTDELRSCLSPDRNDMEEQNSRLLLCMQALQLRPSRIIADLDETLLAIGKEVCGYKKQQSFHKDIQILQSAKSICLQRVGSYSSMEQIANSLKLDKIESLLAASLEDSRNAVAYFIQIEQNILYPAVAKIDRG